ncbi:MAG: DUF507 family protein [Campylobacterota bacterium]
MRLHMPHAPYVANKISIDLANSPIVRLTKGRDPVRQIAQEMIEENIKQERALEERVEEMLEDHIDEIEFVNADERQLFWMIKKKIADEYGVILNYEDRYNDLAHRILDRVYDNYLLEYEAKETQVKNVIYKAIEGYIKSFEKIEDIVLEKIDSYKREIIPGSEEFNLIFEKLYEEELAKRGFLK